MRIRHLLRACAVAAVLACAAAAGSAGQTGVQVPPRTILDRCNPASFTKLNASAGSVHAVDVVRGETFTPVPGAPPLTGLPTFCRVQGSIVTSADSLVNFEVWIPETWNRKLVATGNAGFSNALNYLDMAHALSQRYAAVGGDTGHQTPTPDDLLWGAGHRERIVDWGSRSIHAIVGPARRIVERVAGAGASRAYFYGCSTGGHQAYAEVQRYPRDFDGVIAGAPGNNRVRLNVGFFWQFVANHDRGANPAPIIPASKLPMVTRAVVAACDANDGIKDGVVDDPRTCRFDASSLECNGTDAGDCLTRRQIEALEKMYGGARNPRTGDQIYPGWPKGSEALTVSADGRPLAGWQRYWGDQEPARVEFWRRWVFEDSKWDWRSFDFDADVRLAEAKLGPMIDQVNPDIATFRSHGGKAIVYQGWQDPVVNAFDTIAYYESVRSRQGSQEAIDRFFRLFMVPGMAHCSGGPGPTSFGNQNAPSPIADAQHDLLMALDAWVETGAAPERLIASRVEDGVTIRTRPLCPYPKKAVYTGTGSTDDASSFVCR